MRELFGGQQGELYNPFREEAAASLERTREARARIMAGEPEDGTHLDYLLRVPLTPAQLERWRDIARRYRLEGDEMAWLKWKARGGVE